MKVAQELIIKVHRKNLTFSRQQNIWIVTNYGESSLATVEK